MALLYPSFFVKLPCIVSQWAFASPFSLSLVSICGQILVNGPRNSSFSYLSCLSFGTFPYYLTDKWENSCLSVSYFFTFQLPNETRQNLISNEGRWCPEGRTCSLCLSWKYLCLWDNGKQILRKWNHGQQLVLNT